MELYNKEEDLPVLNPEQLIWVSISMWPVMIMYNNNT